MTKLKQILPDFIAEVQQALREIDFQYLADDLNRSELNQWTKNRKNDSLYISVKSDAKRCESVVLEELEGWVVVDVDGKDRVIGIETFKRDDIRRILEESNDPTG